MATYLYDEALVNKLKMWTNSTDVHVYGPNETSRLFETIADTKNDAPIKLPIISVTRDKGFTINNPNKQPLSFDGLTLEASYEKSVMLNAVPISLTYQIDVYTRYQKEADEFVRNLVFNFINFPVLTIKVPYNSADIELDSTIQLQGDVQDNSDVPERIVAGQFTRYTLTIAVKDAYLYDVRIRDNVHIHEVYIANDEFSTDKPISD